MLYWVANHGTMTRKEDWPGRTHVWWINYELAQRTTRSHEEAWANFKGAIKSYKDVYYTLTARPEEVWNDIFLDWGFRNDSTDPDYETR